MSYRIFTPAIKADFIARPNRFVIEARLPDGRRVTAHCPNPGRMRELLLPGRQVILERSDSRKRKTGWTLAAVLYDGKVMPLISARSSEAAGALVLPEIFPGCRFQSEQFLGRSRIDWKVTGTDGVGWAEVKACTLVERKRAMFPDAPSERAVKHLEELSLLAERRAVIMTIMNPSAEIFSANPHTDPAFSIALAQAAARGLDIHAVSMRCDADGYVNVVNQAVPVDLCSAELASRDDGVVLRIWKNADNLKALTVSRCAGRVRQESRRRRFSDRSDSILDSVLVIRGPMEVFGDLEDELSGIFTMDVLMDGIDRDIAGNPDFLELLLDYRHHRVFNP